MGVHLVESLTDDQVEMILLRDGNAGWSPWAAAEIVADIVAQCEECCGEWDEVYYDISLPEIRECYSEITLHEEEMPEDHIVAEEEEEDGRIRYLVRHGRVK
jgi:hypothetical protein